MSTKRRVRLTVPALALALSALLCGVAACSSSGSGSSGEPAPSEAVTPAAEATEAPLADLLPDEIKSAGVLHFGTENQFPPFELAGEDGEEVVGVTIDLADEIGKLLGVEPKLSVFPFDALIPSLMAKRFDVLLDVMGDTPDRRKLVDFVDFYSGGTLTFVAGGNPKGITGGDDLCGRTVGIQRGSVQVPQSDDIQAACEKAGKPKMDLQVFDSQNALILGITTQRVDAILSYGPAANYAAQQSGGKFEPTGETFVRNTSGLCIRKGEKQLGEALQAAIQELMDNGTYLEILKKWGAESGAITESTINLGTGFGA